MKQKLVKQTINLVIPGVVSAHLLATPVKKGVRPTPMSKPKHDPTKPPVVSPPEPQTPVLKRARLELPANCDNFLTNTVANHTVAIVSIFNGPVKIQDITYGLGLVSIVPPVGNWVEQSLDFTNTYRVTGAKLKQLVAGANNTTSVNLTLDGGVGPAKLMRYLLEPETL